jgi:uncharacterized protein (TIGR02246 family)
MKTHRSILTLFPLVLVSALGGISSSRAAESDPREEAIFQTAKAFEQAFEKGDAAAVASFWTPNGDYVDPNGRVLQGRKAIEEDFVDLFSKNKGLKARIEMASVKFPTADTAVEDGTTAVISPDGSTPTHARYSNFFVKQDGKWLLASVRETAYIPPSNHEKLRGLEWVIGDWVDEKSGSDSSEHTEVSFAWTPDHNFIVSTRTIRTPEGLLDQGTQWIGWDPAAKTIRSWNFEADGGFGQGVWSHDGDIWTIKTTSVLADGGKVTATHTLRPVSDGKITLQSKEQTLEDKALPDSQEITMKHLQ